VVAGFLVLLIVLVLLLVWQALSWLREKKSPSLKEVSVCLIGLIVVFNLIFWQTFRW
jgi:ABC-type nickel/cobalt efflux system permease component RcnA